MLRYRGVHHQPWISRLIGLLNQLLAAIGCRIAARLLANETKLVSAGIRRYRYQVAVFPEALQLLERALIAGEDKRFGAHQGVDVRALVRATVSTFLKHKRQGGSTIEQQLVRTLRRRYEYTIRRKLTEICLACAVSRAFSKDDLLRAYLAVAYFGWRGNGINAAMRRHLKWGNQFTVREAAFLIALLRYPLPQHPSAKILEQVERRRQNILRAMAS